MEWRILDESGRLSFGEFLQLLCSNEEFREFFNDLLCAVPYEAFRWETPKLTHDNAKRDFRFVTISAASLNRRANNSPFSEHFHQKDGVTVFPSLGGDAVMIVPTPPTQETDYVHIADFVREAPKEVRSRLWQLTGETVLEMLGTKPLWLNTAGGGVAWLHVRIDSRPKYYHHRKYAEGS